MQDGSQSTDLARNEPGDGREVHRAIAKVMGEIQAVAKNKTSKGGGNFAYRGIDEIVNEIHSRFVVARLYIVPKYEGMIYGERATKADGIERTCTLEASFRIISGVDGSEVTIGPIPGEGFDTRDKAAQKAMSAALKYALTQTFLIPTADVDPFEDASPGVTGNRRPIMIPPDLFQKTLLGISNATNPYALDRLTKECDPYDFTPEQSDALTKAYEAAKARIEGAKRLPPKPAPERADIGKDSSTASPTGQSASPASDDANEILVASMAHLEKFARDLGQAANLNDLEFVIEQINALKWDPPMADRIGKIVIATRARFAPRDNPDRKSKVMKKILDCRELVQIDALERSIPWQEWSTADAASLQKHFKDQRQAIVEKKRG